ncbi:MAG TPA: PfkB family carbohydrate kinase [Aquabacterium sp.]|nr:PfkB family carbohydrate kinase [Aquabacterium sp.]
MQDRPPVVWLIAGLDTAGGAGLSADQRATQAMGAHGCPVAATLTAQHSRGVEAVFAVPRDQLEAQLNALASDMPPRVIKTGLLGSVDAIQLVAAWVDRLRAQAPIDVHPHRHLALVVDPVLRATAGGVSFSDPDIVRAYCEHLLPRATVLTPNHREAVQLASALGLPSQAQTSPELARVLREAGARNVVITGGDAPLIGADAQHSIDWIDTVHARGWLSSPRLDMRHTHGTGCTFASGVASALALGHVEADAVVLAKMLTYDAIHHGHRAGTGAGPVKARQGFAQGPARGGAPLPLLGLDTDLPWRLSDAAVDDVRSLFHPFTPPRDGLYAIVPDADLLEAALRQGLECVQLRHKHPETAPEQVSQALRLACQHDALVVINDHWKAALLQTRKTPVGLHLGQEDLLGLTPHDRRTLLASRDKIVLGLSSHSVWELARAAGCGASLIACGPLQPTTTKDMPWHPQGLDNLSWWVANSPSPVVGIGGLLTADDLSQFAGAGAAALCVVRGLGHSEASMAAHLPALRAALQPNRQQGDSAQPELPHPVLPW